MMRRSHTPLPGLFATLVLALGPAPGADLAVMLANAPTAVLADHFTARLARGVARRRRWAEVLDPEAIAKLPRPPATPLAGALDHDQAAAWQAALGTPFVVRSGLTPDGRVAIAQLQDLRGPWLLGQARLTAANQAELLAATDDLAARLATFWPLEATATVAEQNVQLDRGQVHGWRRGGTVWLLADAARDELGQYAHPVAIARLTQVYPRAAHAVIEAASPDFEAHPTMLAASPASLATAASPWLPHELGLVRRDGAWSPELWGWWQRLASPGAGPDAWAVPGQVVRQAPAVVPEERLPQAALPRLEPAGPWQVGTPWTVTIAPLDGAVELSLIAPDGRTQLLLWRGPDTPQPVTVRGLAGPSCGTWTLRLIQHGETNAVGEVTCEVVP